MINPLLIELPTRIETQRLLMRPPQAGDGVALCAAVAESLPELRRFLASLPWIAKDPTVESSEIFCRNGYANFMARRDFPFLLFEKATGQLLGVAGLHRVEWTVPKAEVGYWVRTSRARNGFISEAVDALVQFAFTHFHAVRVSLTTDEANAASRRLADRCQFVLEGTLRNECREPNGALRNTCIYARCPPAP